MTFGARWRLFATSMNLKLVFLLSLFGLAMALGTVFVIPEGKDGLFWLPIFLFCAFMLAKRAPSKAPLHGLVLGLMNCVWMTGLHMAFSER